MSRIVRLLALFTAAMGALALPASAALAQVPPPDPAGAGELAPATARMVTHTVFGSGLAIWTVLVIAATAIAVGVGLTELVHALRRHDRSQPLATA
jgi:hypothetical protein